LTSEQIERGLRDESDDIRMAFASRVGNLSPEQFERGLADLNSDIRFLYASRPDFHPNQAQMERGLRDKKPEIAAFFEENQAVWLTRMTSQKLKDEMTGGKLKSARKAL
jgi:hypothetical protein